MSPTNGTTTAPAAAAAVAATQVSSGPGSSGLRRLQAADGLFLRAEHLNQIQTFAATLSRLSTMAGGAGTVWGYDLSLPSAPRRLDVDGLDPAADPSQGPVKGTGGTAADGTTPATVLTVLPGLAVSGAGRPLRCQAPLTVDLDGLETGVPGRFWVVEVLPAPAAPAGNEPAYTAVCATSCGPGVGIQPWADERVQVRVRAMQIELDWESAPVALRRSALASAWFERERRLATPWLTPAIPGSVVPPVAARPWDTSAPRAEPGEEAVPLGLLLHAEGRWHVDMWAARRDRGDTPPQGAWLGRLSMRPWPVFAAQVLQFEAQLDRLAINAPLSERFAELPPGGFVDLEPGASDTESLGARLSDRFGDLVDVNVHLVTADEAVRQVAEAQHLDRVPLWRVFERRPVVDVWVPSVPPDLEHTQVEFRSWVGFTHAQPYSVEGGGGELVRGLDRGHPGSRATTPSVVEEAATDPVAVHLVRGAPTRRDRRASAAGEALAGAPAVVLELGAGEWAVTPAHLSTVASLRRKIGKDAASRVAYWVVSSGSPDRVPLLTARAQSLADALGVSAESRTVHDVPREDGPDAIVVMVAP